MLEDILVANPDMLMRGLRLVGRQLPVETGSVDLLGIDDDGRLVVFELKREKLTRVAVAQILDYCSHLEALPDSDLASLIAERSGQRGIERIADFDEWYASQVGDSIKPVRMVLVGLGVDRSASRMVAYLADRGIDVRLLTFHGYVRGDDMLLARQVRAAKDHRRPSTPRDRDLNQKAREHGVEDVWQDAKQALNYSLRTYFTKAGITCLQRTITLPDDVPVRASHSVTIDEPGKIRITFYPGAIDLCHERFQELKEAIPFDAEKPPNAPPTRRAPHSVVLPPRRGVMAERQGASDRVCAGYGGCLAQARRAGERRGRNGDSVTWTSGRGAGGGLSSRCRTTWTAGVLAFRSRFPAGGHRLGPISTRHRSHRPSFGIARNPGLPRRSPYAIPHRRRRNERRKCRNRTSSGRCAKSCHAST